jgi:DNA-binding response OmpR family regulator
LAKILIVEDDPDIADLLQHYLAKAGHEIFILNSGADVMPRVQGTPVDLVILDLMLPHMDGLTVCRMLRSHEATRDLPIMMLTARSEEADRIAGLELGADDYVTKPFSPKEVTARVTALLRRSTRQSPGAAASIIRYGPIIIDVERHNVTVNGSDVKLTAKEFLLLQFLVERKGRVVSRDLLLTDVWGYQYTGGTRTVDVHIRRLREKIPVLEQAIQTVKQFGYRLEDEP